MNTPLALLNQLTPTQFLAEYWQKKPLLIRQAIPNFQGLLDGNDLAGLACEEEAQSRLVRFSDGQWHTEQGPFDEDDFSNLPEHDWTLLVQGVNHFLPEADALLRQFNFIPYARLDDLMVSYAPKGGGVGPHFDSYDVFLLQGSGKRRWKVSHQSDKSIIEGAPLRILKKFACDDEWVLEPGDMLYLPPQLAHWGIAETDDCMTYSIGFRAPKTIELAMGYLEELQSNMRTNSPEDRLYQDADLNVTEHPAEISISMVDKVHTMLTQMPWHAELIGPFLARYLSEPKPHIYFEPNPKLSFRQFEQVILKQGICLDLKSQLLYWQNTFYLNGELIAIENNPVCQENLFYLANMRKLEAQSLKQTPDLMYWLFDCYLAGFCHINTN